MGNVQGNCARTYKAMLETPTCSAARHTTVERKVITHLRYRLQLPAPLAPPQHNPRVGRIAMPINRWCCNTTNAANRRRASLTLSRVRVACAPCIAQCMPGVCCAVASTQRVAQQTGSNRTPHSSHTCRNLPPVSTHIAALLLCWCCQEPTTKSRHPAVPMLPSQICHKGSRSRPRRIRGAGAIGTGLCPCPNPTQTPPLSPLFRDRDHLTITQQHLLQQSYHQKAGSPCLAPVLHCA